MNGITIFQNEQFGKVRITINDNNELLFIYENSNGQCSFNVYEILAMAYQSDDYTCGYKLILLLDGLSVGNESYWVLRDAVMSARTAWRMQENNSHKNERCKTYLMKDENTGFTKIGKSIHPTKRERTLQSEKPTISLFKICDELVEKELHSHFATKHIRGEWYHLSNEDIEYIISKYDFK